MTSVRCHPAAMLAAIAIIGVTATVATAADYCVTCTEPDANYTCEVRGLAEQAAAGMQGQLLCIKSIAAESGHKTCSVNRNAPAACSGPLRVVGLPEPAAAASIEAPKPRVPGAVAAVPADKPAAPSAKGALEAAQHGITDAAKKSWTCVTSLFKDC